MYTHTDIHTHAYTHTHIYTQLNFNILKSFSGYNTSAYFA